MKKDNSEKNKNWQYNLGEMAIDYFLTLKISIFKYLTMHFKKADVHQTEWLTISEFALPSLLSSPALETARFSRAFTISRLYVRKVDYISKLENKVTEAVTDLRPFAVVVGTYNFCFPFPYSFIYAVARRNPFLYAPTILSLAADYEHSLQSCCKESDVGTCLDEKVDRIFHCG